MPFLNMLTRIRTTGKEAVNLDPMHMMDLATDISVQEKLFNVSL